jgi:DNA repair exonuclease SbcCD ATPase subunit
MPLKVRVRNYQSIADGTITIDGLTSLTGTNNAGKSAMFRAIRGAFTNTRGSDFVRLGESHATVEIEDLKDGHTLKWEKGAKVNRYTINGKKFDRVGHGVPAEMAVFGVSPVAVGGTDLWPQIAPQMNGVMFLLDQPGSVIAEAVADVERVNQLNKALKMSESDRRTAKADLKVRIADGEKLAKRREDFTGLDDTILVVAGLEKRHSKATKVAKAHTNLVKMGERYKTARDAVEALAGLGDVEALMPSEARVGKAKAFRQALQVTVDLAVRYEAAVRDQELAQEAQKAMSNVVLDGKLAMKAERVKRALSKTKDLRERLVKGRELVDTLDLEIEKREQELVTVSTSATELLGTFTDCPTCDRRMDHAH